jgi:hypothetical protein
MLLYARSRYLNKEINLGGNVEVASDGETVVL